MNTIENIKMLDKDLLDKICNSVVSCLQKQNKEDIFDFSTTKFYHEYAQTQAKLSFLRPYLNEYDINEDSLYVILGHVSPSYVGAVHAHKSSHALCYLLGEKEGFTNAIGAYAVRSKNNWIEVKAEDSIGLKGAPFENWFPIYSGDKIYNYQTVAHGFCSRGETTYDFLCIQSPGIDNPKFDDWISAKINKGEPELDGVIRAIVGV